MRIVFMGTPDFAVPCLKRLAEDGHEIAAVYTKPDSPKNRGMKLTESPVKELARELGLRVIQPVRFSDEGVAEELATLGPELIAVVAYGRILPQRVLDIPPLGCVNIHGSILPKYRGAAPIQWTVLNGDSEAGVTAQYMAAELDSGDIIGIKKTAVGQYESSGELYTRLSALGAELLSETVADIAAGRAERTPQEHESASFAPMLSKDMSPIDWSKTAFEIKNQVCGLSPWPVATCVISGRKLKIHAVRLSGDTTGAEPGTVLGADGEGIRIACGGGGVIVITELQAEGKKRMRAADYLRGNPVI